LADLIVTRRRREKEERCTVDYTLRINDQTVDFQMISVAEGHVRVTASDVDHEVTYCMVSDNHIQMWVDQAAVCAHLSAEGDRMQVMIDGQIYQVGEYDAAREALSVGGSGLGAQREVTPPMPAVVVRVLVEAGVEVIKGQPLVVLAAMKMETTLTAPFAGRVVSVNTVEGAKVMPGEILVNLASDEADQAA
jgi:acetyl/propionyl-CoA carboxylase alpha subunit